MFRRSLYKSYILFYSFSQWFRWHFTKTGRVLLLVLLFAAIFGLDTRNTLTFQLASLLFFLFLISMLSTFFQKKGFRVYRKIPDYVPLEKDLNYELLIVNTGSKTHTSLEIIDAPEVGWPEFEQFLYTRAPGEDKLNVFDRFMGYQRWEWLVHKNKKAVFHAEIIDTISPGEKREICARCTPVQRGSVRIKGCLVGVQDPLGLFRTYVLVGHSDNILLLPRRYLVPRLVFSGNKPYQPGGLSLAYSVGENMEISSLREYQRGDPLRLVHWKSWAKQGKPIVKEFTEEYIVRQGLVLDTFLLHKDRSLFEEAVSVAASITETRASNDSVLDLLYVNNTGKSIQVGRGGYSLEYILKVLARVDMEKNSSFQDLSNLVLEGANYWSGCVCIFLDWSEDRKNLVGKLRNKDVQVLVLVISQGKDQSHTFHPGPMHDLPHMFRVLPVNDISGALQRL